jgi:hypothetical protein
MSAAEVRSFSIVPEVRYLSASKCGAELASRSNESSSLEETEKCTRGAEGRTSSLRPRVH